MLERFTISLSGIFVIFQKTKTNLEITKISSQNFGVHVFMLIFNEYTKNPKLIL